MGFYLGKKSTTVRIEEPQPSCAQITQAGNAKPMPSKPAIPATPEERLDAPLDPKYEPKDVPGDSLSRLETILDVAVRGRLIPAEDAEGMLRILRINPHARLARLGQRLSLIESVVADLKSVDTRIKIAMDWSGLELELVRVAAEHVSTWRRPQGPELDECIK